MRKDLVKYQDDDFNVEIEVGQATIEMGLTRSNLWFEIRPAVAEKTLVTRIGLLNTYPAVKAATLEIRNLPKVDADGITLVDADGSSIMYPEQLVLEDITLDSYLLLPEALGAVWKDAVFALNPHWLPALAEEDGDEGEVQEPDKETS